MVGQLSMALQLSSTSLYQKESRPSRYGSQVQRFTRPRVLLTFASIHKLHKIVFELRQTLSFEIHQVAALSP